MILQRTWWATLDVGMMDKAWQNAVRSLEMPWGMGRADICCTPLFGLKNSGCIMMMVFTFRRRYGHLFVQFAAGVEGGLGPLGGMMRVCL